MIRSLPGSTSAAIGSTYKASQMNQSTQLRRVATNLLRVVNEVVVPTLRTRK